MSLKEATKELSVSIQDAAFPKPFYQGLEFNAPVHGPWNIVHIGMLLPESRQIYVCADNCMRGVVLTAAEMKAEERFSFVLLEERDLIMGKLEDITIDGVSECINSLPQRPPVVLLFTVCVHHFLGCDLDYIYRKLGERYPDIYFCRCYMDPLLQKSGPTPDQKLRLAMYEPIKPLKVNPRRISLIGSEFALHKSCDIYRLMALVAKHITGNVSESHEFILSELASCSTYNDYLQMGESALFITDNPGAVMALEQLGQRLNRPYLYIPKSFDYSEIRHELKKLFSSLCDIALSKADTDTAVQHNSAHLQTISDKDRHRSITNSEVSVDTTNLDNSSKSTVDKFLASDLEDIFKIEEASCEEAFTALHKLIGDTEIRIDYTFHPRPLGLARQLIAHGFNVTTIYIDVINAEEEADFRFLSEHAPSLKLCSTVQVEARTAPRSSPKVLAVGQKAAWFSGTRHFVNAVTGAGLFGYDGLRRTLELMAEAYNTENDTEELVIRKGWGCASCV